jgi:hypothetical protein
MTIRSANMTRLAGVTIAAASLVSAAHAQSALRSSTIDSGGGMLTAGVHRLTASIGQHDAQHILSGGVYSLRGGFITPVPCSPDFNGVGGVSVQDIFDFLADWNSQVSGGPIMIASADFNGIGGVTVQDIFDFLAAWNNGCP